MNLTWIEYNYIDQILNQIQNEKIHDNYYN